MGPVYPLAPNAMPGLAVAAMDDVLVQDDDGAGSVKRYNFSVEVEGRAKISVGENVDDALDQICLEASGALHEDPTLGGLVGNLTLVRTENDLSAELERPAGIATMVWEGRYAIDVTAPETIIRQ
jgi:hypothetical protein